MAFFSKKDSEKQVSRLLDYKKTFGSEEGKRVLSDMMGRYGMLRSSFLKDPYETAFNEGQRNVILTILTFLEVDYEMLKQKIGEANANNR